MDNAALINKFYTAFANRDAEGMVACYADGVVFEDPAFGRLHGEAAKAMWRMLLQNGNSRVSFDNVRADGKKGSANWTAEYVFSQSGRPVVNKVAASFEFSNGKISKHTDVFDVYAWSKQALGLQGYLIGWTGFFKKQLQKKTSALLRKFMLKQGIG
jgi:ketosteroid isomerase-like protein